MQQWDVSIYFDDFTVEQASYIVKTEDFTPFGTGFNTSPMVSHAFGYNGKEKQPLTRLLHYGFRQYDADLGRWHVPEPLADQMPGISTYAYAYNNVVNYIDLMGLMPGYMPGMGMTEAMAVQQNTSAGVDNAIATGLAGGPGVDAWRQQRQQNNSLLGQVSNFANSLPQGTQTTLTPSSNGNGTLYYQIQVGRAYHSLTSDSFAGGIILLDQGELSYGNPSGGSFGRYNALLERARDGGTYAGYGSGVLGVGQIGMLDYRTSLSINSKIGTFSKFSSTYRGVGVASRTLGKAGTYVGAPLSIYLDYGALQSGQISSERFAYRTVGTGSSVVGGIAIGSSFGGPWGAAGGALIGGAFVAGEIAFDAAVWLWNETSRQISNFKEALKGGWYPGR